MNESSEKLIEALTKGEEYEETFKVYNPVLPKKSFRLIVCGPSGSGKTHLVFRMITKEFAFNKVYLFYKTEQRTYRALRAFFQGVIDLANEARRKEREKEKKKKKKKKAKENRRRREEESEGEEEEEKEEEEELSLEDVFEESPEIIPLVDMPIEGQKLIVFDDMVCTESERRNINDYFIGARVRNCSCVFLTQDHTKTDRTIRVNSTHACVFDFGETIVMDKIARDLGLNRKKFKNAFQDKYDFVFFDKEKKKGMRCFSGEYI